LTDYVDADGMAKYLMHTLSVPATTVRGETEVAQRREERKQMEQQAMQQQQMLAEAQAMGQAAPGMKLIQGGAE